MSKLISELLRPESFKELVLSEEIRSRLLKMQETGNVLNRYTATEVMNSNQLRK